MAIDVKKLLELMIQKGISDIHFKADSHPAMRLHGRLVTAANLQKLGAADIQAMAAQLMTKEQAAAFEKDWELDMAYSLEGVSRFRVNFFRQRSTIGLSLRVIPVKLRTFEELNLPAEPLKRLSQESRGLILFAGVTGAGKTTTMNSFLHHLNQNYCYRVITIEDPVEFFHADAKSTIVQREVGQDTKAFANALKHVLRQDPDVIVIGEMRDKETIEAAISAAETGHLVLSTIHTMNAAQSVDRIIDAYPVHQHAQVRQQLSGTLKGVVAQRLIPTKDGKGRYPAAELLVVNATIRRHLLEGRSTELAKAIEGGSYYGMRSFDQDLLRLYSEGKIDDKAVLENATNPEDAAIKLKSLAAQPTDSGGGTSSPKARSPASPG